MGKCVGDAYGYGVEEPSICCVNVLYNIDYHISPSYICTSFGDLAHITSQLRSFPTAAALAPVVARDRLYPASKVWRDRARTCGGKHGGRPLSVGKVSCPRFTGEYSALGAFRQGSLMVPLTPSRIRSIRAVDSFASDGHSDSASVEFSLYPLTAELVV